MMANTRHFQSYKWVLASALVVGILADSSRAVSAPHKSNSLSGIKRYFSSSQKTTKVHKINLSPVPLPNHRRPSTMTKPVTYVPVDRRPNFDLPVTYNSRVKKWVNYFQTDGKGWFKKWLERSYRYLPIMQKRLKDKGLPQDLAYVAMIESGFSAHAISSAQAVGYWQFIKPTANRYGLATNWWLDERRDFLKSTTAAANYLGDLYQIFQSWYLTAASYNMGETRMNRLIRKYKTKDFWVLARKRGFPKETSQYIPKLIAAMLIAKAPKLYGFKNLKPLKPYAYEYIFVPGGTDLLNLAQFTGINQGSLKRLNPELTKGFIPPHIKNHRIRIPVGASTKASRFIRAQM